MLLREVINTGRQETSFYANVTRVLTLSCFYVRPFDSFQQNVWATSKQKPFGAVLVNFDAPDALNGRKEWSHTPGVRKHDPRPLACAKILIPLFNLYSVYEIEGLLTL